MKNSILFLWTFVCFVSNIHAQITITSTSTPSTCSANGSITIQASGGSMPYNYILDGTPQATLSSASYTINGVASGVHQLQVTDVNAMQSSIILDSVGGNYVEPSLTCVYNNCEVVATVHDGRPPFQYQISYTTATGPFSPYQSSPVFGNLPLVNQCYVRVKDSCNNIYTLVVGINTPTMQSTITCTEVDSVTFAVDVSVTGGVAPYTYTCTTTGNNIVQTNSTGNFTGLHGCYYLIKIEDACGHMINSSHASCLVPKLTLDCIDCANGSIAVTATGGVPPYNYYAYGNSALSNTTGIFNNLGQPYNGLYYNVRVKDACNLYSPMQHYYCLDANVVCGGNGFFDGQVDFYISGNYLTSNPLFPITVICNSCANHDTVVITSAAQNPIHFDGVLSGVQTYTIIDNCDNTFPIYSDCDVDYTSGVQYIPPGGGGSGSGGGSGGSGQNPLGCGNTLVITCQTPNTSYEVYYLTTGALYGANNTGIFPNIPADTFIYHIISPTGFPLKIDTIDTSLFFNYLNKDCRTIMVGACPDSLVFTLKNAAGLVLVTNNTTGIFTNLTPGQWYQIFAKDPLTNRTINEWVQIDSIGELSYNIYACRDLVATLTLPQNAQGTQVVTYTLTGLNTAYYQQNTVGTFPNLPNDTYTLMVTRGNCDTLIRYFTIGTPFTPSFCLIPSGFGGSFTWNVNSLGGVNGAFTLLNSSGNPTQLNYCSPGNYTFISPQCEMYNFTFPTFPTSQLSLVLTSVCSNLACIEATGGLTSQDWYNWSLTHGYTGCNGNPDTYILYKNGQFIASNTSGVFCDLLIGGNYMLVLNRLGINVDTLYIQIPPYQQLNLSGINGVICNGATTGDVTLNVTGSGLPFTFNILNPPTGYSPTQITTNNTSAVFPNLPAGNYQFMVYDGCGVSSDYAANVSNIYFTPFWQRFCDASIQLFAPNYPDWSYTWTNSNGTVVGTTYNPHFADVGVETYTIVVVTPNCSYSTSITTPPMGFISNNLPVNAGPDIAVPYQMNSTFATTNLQGAVPLNSFETVHWTQINPMPSVATIANANQSNTAVIVTMPGIYTFVYTVSSNYCSGTDTVLVHFYDCSTIPIIVNAGANQILPFPISSTTQTANLQGNVPLETESGQWTQIPPMPSIANIATPNQNATAFTVSSPGLYTFIYTITSQACIKSDTVTVNFNNCAAIPIYIDAGADITLPYPYLSPSETAQLQGNVPITGEVVHWTQIAPITASASISSPNQSATSITVNSPGIYTFEYQIVSQTCTKTDTIQVNFFDCKAFSVVLDSLPENCANTSRNGQAIIHVLGGTGPYHFIWDDGKTGEIHTALSTGSHQVTFVDESGCITQNNTFEINVPYISPNVNAFFDSSPSNIADITIEDATINCHNLSTNATSYSWTFGPNQLSSLANNPTFVCTDTGLWTITLYARNAYCHDQYSSVYHVVTDGDVYIANAFTPNGDLDNDAFGPIGWHVVELKFTIYDRWGIMIYQTERMDAPWDGTKKGVPCPEGAYVFVVDALLVTGERFKKAGTVTLIR